MFRCWVGRAIHFAYARSDPHGPPVNYVIADRSRAPSMRVHLRGLMKVQLGADLKVINIQDTLTSRRINLERERGIGVEG
ncbi:hypothetical protein EVAR_38506_1 [Eumeta japonica]|uniref:Uncharacterized protein n=1 Tax=Eumeta variegata TaxID=151549 RepID=A0A4C1WED0_EUMVA|nr:hypothetical protein EVAR_38506_1 [Eumeta japonica]